MAESPLVALTGGSGFVGRHVLPQLLARNYRVRALARHPADINARSPLVEIVPGDLFDDAALARLVTGCDAVVHLVGIIVEKPSAGQTFERVHAEATARLVAAARRAGVKRWVHMSALGSGPEAASRYHQTKWAAEETVRAAGDAMAWTIFRPSIIHGPDGEFMKMVKDFWTHRIPPFVPYFGKGVSGHGGAGRLQPIWVEDVALCFAEAVASPRTPGEVYPMGGPDVYTWPELYEAVRRTLASAPEPVAVREKKIVAVPAWLAGAMAGLPGAPFSKDQVLMSQEDSVCEIGKVSEDFNMTLAAFEPTLSEYAAEIP